jgi:transaldolase
MKPTIALHNLGQSLWLDNITRDLLNSGALQHYITLEEPDPSEEPLTIDANGSAAEVADKIIRLLSHSATISQVAAEQHTEGARAL